MYYYQAFGLTISSEIELPELLTHSPIHNSTVDVTIIVDEVNPSGIETELPGHPFLQMNKNTVWLNVTNTGRFLISSGNQIKVDPFKEIDPAIIRIFILSSCICALLMQRDLFVLHGGAVRIGNACIAFIGNSGVGKSTLSGAFFKRGYSLLADDVCAINQNIHVLPSFPQIKLWADSANILGVNTETLRRVRPNFDKFALPLAEQFHSETLPLRVIYCLNTSSDIFSTQRILGAHKILPLQQHVYRQHYLTGLMKKNKYYKQCADIAKQVEMIDLVRPKKECQLDAMVDYILTDFMMKRMTHSGYNT